MEKKTGLVISLEKLTASRLSALLYEVLNNPIYRQNACDLQRVIANRNGLSHAADLLEEGFGIGKQVNKRQATVD